MKRSGGILIAILLLCPTWSSAHRLDEYLQAARVFVARERIALELDLMPGASIASEIIALMDRDRDGRIAPDEAHAYGRTVLAEIVLMLDGRELPLTLAEVQVPATGVMREGTGAVRVHASAVVSNPTSGRHELFYRNDHRVGASVYLVNAMMPSTRAVSIGSQRRDTRQREFHLAYEVEREGAASEWMVVAALVLGTLIAFRKSVNASSGSAG
jgi:nickel/cobalt transporter (NicO) family protein